MAHVPTARAGTARARTARDLCHLEETVHGRMGPLRSAIAVNEKSDVNRRNGIAGQMAIVSSSPAAMGT
jgi:hypothetical protein